MQSSPEQTEDCQPRSRSSGIRDIRNAEASDDVPVIRKPTVSITKNCKLKCIYTNVSSLRNKMDELNAMIDDLKPDIIGLTETWMKEDCAFQGYHPAFKHNRSEDRRGGGVMLLIHNRLAVTEHVELNTLGFEEAVWCIIQLAPAHRLLVGVCYRSPNSTRANNLLLNEMFCKAQNLQMKGILIMGDFNFPQINWESGFVDGPNGSDAELFFETSQDLFLYQHVNLKTRFRIGNNPSRLDLVFTNEEHMVDELLDHQPLGKSDHVVLSWEFIYRQVQLSDGKKTTPQRLNFRRGRYKDMAKELSAIDWSILDDLEVNDAWDYIKDVLLSKIRKFVPKCKTTMRGTKPPWWKGGLTKQVKKKYKTWKEYILTGGTDEYRKYAFERNKTTEMIRKARSAYEDKLAKSSKTEPKKLYRYIRKQMKVKAVVGPLEKGNGQLAENDRENAEVLNNFFKSVFVKEESDDMLPDFTEDITFDEPLNKILMTSAAVLEELKRLNEDKAAGPE